MRRRLHHVMHAGKKGPFYTRRGATGQLRSIRNRPATTPCNDRRVASNVQQSMKNHYQQSRFLLGTPDMRGAPADNGAEVAFAGRSNAGKSSALNVITGQRSLARISKAPGRTREINFFVVRDDLRLVDLPGYGYAKVSRSMQKQWQQNIARYLETRRSLCGVFLLMDIRHPLKDFDQLVLRWCNAADLQAHVLLTKADKLKRGAANAALLQVRRQLQELHPGSSLQLFSSLTRDGVETARATLDEWLGITADDLEGSAAG
jgi:GTP-binding protein